MPTKSRKKSEPDPESIARKWITQNVDPPGFEKVFIEQKIGM